MINKGFSYIGIFFLYLLSLLPFWFLYIIADVIFIFIYYIIGYRKQVVHTNLRNAFPEKSDAERLQIQKKFFRYFADLVVETLKGITISKKELTKRMVPINHEALLTYLANGRSTIGATGHFCNWEWTGQAYSTLTNHPRLTIYKPLSNKIFDDFFIKIRSRFGATPVEMKNTLRKMTEKRKELFLSVLVADQTPVKHEAHYFTTFLNQPTAVFLGIEKLAKLFNTPVVFCDIRRVKRGYYTYNFVPLVENPQETAEYEITELHVKYLEEMIRQEPQYWLWSHRRWKFKPEDKN